jgi:hypothetical protein
MISVCVGGKKSPCRVDQRDCRSIGRGSGRQLKGESIQRCFGGLDNYLNKNGVIG